MKTERLQKELSALADDIAKGAAAMLGDKYGVSIGQYAERDLGTLLMMNVPAVLALVHPASKANRDAEYAYQLGVEAGQAELVELRAEIAAQRPTDTAKPNQPGAVEAVLAAAQELTDWIKTHEYPAMLSPEWMKLTQLIDKQDTALRKLKAAKPSDESAGAAKMDDIDKRWIQSLTEDEYVAFVSGGKHAVTEMRTQRRVKDDAAAEFNAVAEVFEGDSMSVIASVQAAEGAGDTLAKRIVKEVTPSLRVLGDSLGDDAIVHMVKLRMTEIVQLRKEVEESAQATRRRCGELHAKMVEEAWNNEFAKSMGETDAVKTMQRSADGHAGNDSPLTAQFLRKLAALLQSKFAEGKQ